MRLFILMYIFLITSSVTIKPKFCVNCKYFISTGASDAENEYYAKCSFFPKENGGYLITGNKNSSNNFYHCSTARGYSDMCGENATHYKRKRIKRVENASE